MVCRMQETELNFTSPKSGFQLFSKVRVSKPFVENRSVVLHRISIYAVWDTGAAVSAISRRAAERLGMRKYERSVLATATGALSTFNDIVLLDLFIDDYLIPVQAAVVDSIPGVSNDFLIGMDVIQCGDLSVSTDHAAHEFKISFKPYSGMFKPLADILRMSNNGNAIDDR